MGRTRRLKKKKKDGQCRVLSAARVYATERMMDAESFRDTVGTRLYDRVMHWNDSGAVDALRAAEQRRKAKEIKTPCWVPKLKNDLYIGPVDWGMEESEDVLDVPKSAVTFAEELHDGWRDDEESDPGIHAESRSNGNLCTEKKQIFDMWDKFAVLRASIDVPRMVDAVLERGTDGLRLVVGGHPVEPSGWDDTDSEESPAAAADSEELPAATTPCLVEAVLEEFEDGHRLLVGGWPVQPSWDELDTNWSQLGWDAHKKPKYADADDDANDCRRGRAPPYPAWYYGKLCNSFSQGRYSMKAF